MTPETRSYAQAPELRTNPDGSRTLRGYAAVWGARSLDLGGFTEVVAPGAFRASLDDATRDVLATFNHDLARVLGRRSASTLRVGEDATGLAYAVDLDPEDPDAISVARKLARGDVRGSSFTFLTTADAWEQDDAGRPLRTLVAAELIELGPVTDPAYPDTSAAIRSLTRGEADALTADEIAARVASATSGDPDPERPALVAARLAHLRRRF